nr:3140_t:CDS:2 [Entrophospora candida]
MKAQEYINQKYQTKEQKKDIRELDLSNLNLEGDLDFADFNNLKEINISGMIKQKISLPTAEEIRMDNLTTQYLSEFQLSNLRKLNEIKSNDNFKLVKLEIETCPSLKEIRFPNSQLSSLNLNGAPNLEIVDLYYGKLVSLNYLKLGNWDDRLNEMGINNRFYGSLEPLKNLTKLEHLSVANTDIDSGLDYLPNSIKSFCGLGEEIEGENFLEKLRTFKNRIENQLKTRLEESEKERKDNLKLFLEIQNKKKGLKQLKATAKEKLEVNQKLFINNLLGFQEKIIRLEEDSTQSIVAEEVKKLNEVKEKLKEKITQEEISNLCRKKIELTKLEINLEQLQEQEFEARQEISQNQ